MAGVRYELLQDEAAWAPSSAAWKTALGMAGLVLSTAGLTSHYMFSAADDKIPWARSKFVPKEGEEAVVVKPTPPGLLQAWLPAQLFGPSCLFSYSGTDKSTNESEQPFAASATLDTAAWLFGAKNSCPLAVPTGDPADVLKGRLLCWSAWSFRTQRTLKSADAFRQYDLAKDKSDDKKAVRRRVVTVVRLDNRTQQAFWYYQLAFRKWKPRQTVTAFVKSFNKKGNGIADKPNSPRKLEIPFVIPGENVTVTMGKACKGVVDAELGKVLDPSPYRVDPKCPHFTECGGCRWQHIDYQQQLRYKQESINLHFGDLITPEVEQRPIVPCKVPWEYRNKMEFTFSATRGGERYLGLFKDGPHRDVFNVLECDLCSPWVTAVTAAVRTWWVNSGLSAWSGRTALGSLRVLMTREGMRTGDRMVVLTVSGNKSYALTEAQAQGFRDAVVEVARPEPPGKLSVFIREQITQEGQATQFCSKQLYGSESLREELLVPLPQGERRLRFQITPGAFFQPNTYQAEKLYGIALKLANISQGDHVFDLYCGTGTLGICAALVAGKVTGVELNEFAAEDAKLNAERNGCQNVEIRTSPVNSELYRLRKEGIRGPDVIMVDPPRAGLDPPAIQEILRFAAPRLVYVSCNPSTQAENIRQLVEGGYRLKTMQAVDQFPHTAHVEHVAFLQLESRTHEVSS